MTSINSLTRTAPLDLSSAQHLPPSNAQPSHAMALSSNNSPVPFVSGTQQSQVNFGNQSNFPQQPQENAGAGAGDRGDPLAQLITLIQEMLQRLQALMQGGSDSASGASNNAVTGGGGGGGGGGGRTVGEGPARDLVDSQPSANAVPHTGGSSGSGRAAGNFLEHSLGNQLSVQKSPEDRIGMANDPERGDVIKVDFNKGHYTANSTSPRAEIKDGTKLEEGQPYSFKFGMKREANNDGTFFQVLDHNNAKPSPRAWLATKDGQYQLHLKTSDDSNAPSKVFNIGKPGDAAKDVGKWADFQIDFKRGIGDGEISVTKNGENVLDKKGISTMFNTHSSDSYAKFGQYRNEGDHKPATSLFSDFSVAKG